MKAKKLDFIWNLKFCQLCGVTSWKYGKKEDFEA